MGIFIKAVASVILACIFTLILAKQGKDYSVLLALGVSTMVVIVAGVYLQPVIDFVKRLATIGGLDSDMLQILLKSVGIGLLSEFSVLVCKDAGNQAMGKALQILSAGVILWIAIPLLEKFLDLLEKVLKI